MLIWDTYPNLGVDDRNQFDRLRDMPGGLAAVKDMIADFHRRNVKVFFPKHHGTWARAMRAQQIGMHWQNF